MRYCVLMRHVEFRLFKLRRVSDEVLIRKYISSCSGLEGDSNWRTN